MYKRQILTLVFLSFSCISFAQKKSKVIAPQNEGVVTYAFKNNGVESKFAPPLQLFFKDNMAQLIQGRNPEKKDKQFIDYDSKETYQVMTAKDGNHYTCLLYTSRCV